MLVTDPASELWIRKLNSNVESLFDCYVEGRPRLEAYKKTVERILKNVKDGFNMLKVRLDPMPLPSRLDDVTNGLNFSLPLNAARVVHTFLDEALMIMDLDSLM